MSPSPSSWRAFLTVRETATVLRVDPATIYRAIRDDAFPAVRVRGRYVIPARAVEELATRAVEAGGCFDIADLARTERRHQRTASKIGEQS
jgi:excisionase family DNA binding protein